jgi:hypothetical protein
MGARDVRDVGVVVGDPDYQLRALADAFAQDLEALA